MRAFLASGKTFLGTSSVGSGYIHKLCVLAYKVFSIGVAFSAFITKRVIVCISVLTYRILGVTRVATRHKYSAQRKTDYKSK
jgi:hypothetical protein